MSADKKMYNVIYLPNVNTYNQVKKKHPFITKQSSHDYWDEFMEYFTEEICSTRNGADLPGSLGWLFMGAFPSKDNKFKDKRRYCEAIDGTEPFKIQERDGYECRIVYTHTRSKKKAYAPTFYGFKPITAFKEECTDYFKRDWKRYVVIPNIRFMDGVMRTLESGRKMRKNKLQKHNEFED